VIDREDYARLLGYPKGKPLEGDVALRAEEAIDWFVRCTTPRAYVRTLGVEAVAGFTAGAEVESRITRLWREERVDEAYFLDRLAASVVETLAARTGRELRAGTRRSPGCGDLPFEAQFSLMSKLKPLAPSIELHPSGMLTPRHSLLALFPLAGRGSLSPCAACGLARCRFRRAA
jgi:hypothetical protein